MRKREPTGKKNKLLQILTNLSNNKNLFQQILKE
jgi:hypothetical protein